MKLNEFVDRLYAMGGIEQDNKNRKLNESYTYDLYDEIFDKYKSDDYKDVGDIYNEIMFDYDDEDLADDIVSRIELYRHSMYDDYDEDDLDESLTEARNPENDEVNAVLRKWANSDRNRLSKRDQKVLDDAGISLKTDRYDAPHKYAVHKNNEGDIVDLHRMDKHHIKRVHPDHDLANDLATTGRHWSNRDRYNKNKDPRFPWRDAEYRSETPEESDALRPYSDKYKSLKRAVDDSEGYPFWHAGAEQDLDDFRASIPKRKNESFSSRGILTESLVGIYEDYILRIFEKYHVKVAESYHDRYYPELSQRKTVDCFTVEAIGKGFPEKFLKELRALESHDIYLDIEKEPILSPYDIDYEQKKNTRTAFVFYAMIDGKITD